MSIQDRKTINRYLGNRGLATLENPGGLCAQLGFLVEDEKHFQQLINRCEPQYRREMYEALRPHLSFEPKPLDHYLAQLAIEAEVQQLPTTDEDGNLHAFRVQDIRTVQTVVEEQLAQHHLVLTCRKCTKQEAFHSGTKADAIHKARMAGWTYGLDTTGKGIEICPDCPAARN